MTTLDAILGGGGGDVEGECVCVGESNGHQVVYLAIVCTPSLSLSVCLVSLCVSVCLSLSLSLFEWNTTLGMTTWSTPLACN